MLSTILSAFTVKEIRKKLAFTAMMLALYRVGSHIPVPGIDIKAVEEIQEQFGSGGILNLLNVFSGGGLSRIAIFALGIMPYITASIILQLLKVVVPVAREAVEGGRGRAGAHHAVHALPHRRPRVRAVDRLRLPLQELRAERRDAGHPDVRRGRTSS